MATPVETGAATPVIESTETDVIEVKQEISQITDDQWRAMKTIIENIIDYRDSEYVLLLISIVVRTSDLTR